MRTDDPVDNFHSRMAEAVVVNCLVTLVGLLLDLDLYKRESSAKVIITLAKFGSSYPYFELFMG